MNFLANLLPPRGRVLCVLLLCVFGPPLVSAQVLEFRSVITQVTDLAGVNHAAWSPDGNHLYAITSIDHTLIVFTSDASGSLTFEQVLRDGAEGVEGLDGGSSVAVSHDGKSVYATGETDDAVAVFDRDETTGLLTFVEAHFDGQNGVDGLNVARFAGVSPDDAHVYVRGSDTIAIFSRDTGTGALTFLDVVRNNSLLAGGTQLAVSADGANLYTVAASKDTLVVYSRDAATGALTFIEFFEAPPLFGSTDNPVDGLEEVRSVAISPDDQTVYTVSRTDDALVVFDRDPTTGQLTHVQTLEDDVDGVDGLDNAFYVTVSSDGASVYAVSSIDDAISVFDRNASTGMLTFAAAMIDGQGGITGLDFPRAVIVNPGATVVHGISSRDRTLVGFTRDPGTGALTFSGVREEVPGGVIGLSRLRSLAIDPGGTVVYTAGFQDDAIGVFLVDPFTSTLSFVEAQKNGINGVAGLTGVRDVVVSPDRRHVYAISPPDDAIAIFQVVGQNGELRFLKAVYNTGPVSGLDDPQSLAISPDNRHLYVTGPADNAVVVFARNPLSGDLGHVQTLRNGEDFTGMSFPGSIAISPDGTLALVVSALSSNILAFRRDPETGRLAHEPTATAAERFGSAAKRVVFTPDGFHFFVITESPQHLLVYVVDVSFGQLVLTEIQDIQDSGTGVDVSADGSRVYVTDADTSSIQGYARDPKTGILILGDIQEDGIDGVSGLSDPAPVAAEPGALGHVVIGDRDGALSLFQESSPRGGIDIKVTKTLDSIEYADDIEDLTQFTHFVIVVENIGTVPAPEVLLEDKLAEEGDFAGLKGVTWEVRQSTIDELPAGTKGESALSLTFSMGLEDRLVIDFTVVTDIAPSRTLFNDACADVSDDVNHVNNKSRAGEKGFDVIHADSFVQLFVAAFTLPCL